MGMIIILRSDLMPTASLPLYAGTPKSQDKGAILRLLGLLPREAHYLRIAEGYGSPEDIIQAAAAQLQNFGVQQGLADSLEPVFAALRQYQNDHGTAQVNVALGILPAGFSPPLVTGKGERHIIFYPENTGQPRKIALRHELSLAIHAPQGAGHRLAGVFPRQQQRGLMLQIARPAQSDNAQLASCAVKRSALKTGTLQFLWSLQQKSVGMLTNRTACCAKPSVLRRKPPCRKICKRHWKLSMVFILCMSTNIKHGRT